MKPRILITGGSGLLALNWALAVRDRFSITLGLHKRNVSVPGIQTQAIDLESIDSLVRSIENLDPLVVIHSAGLTSVERCESDPGLAHHANVTLAANVAKACDILGVKLVHVSTDHLFDGQDIFVDENHVTAPVNVYGKTKAEAEWRVLESNPHSLVIRTNFFGWGTSYRHSFSDMVIDALRSGEELKLFRDVFYTPILVESVASVIHDLIDLNANGIFNVVGDERISKFGFGLKIAAQFSLDSQRIRPVLFLDQAALVLRPLDMSLSNRKVSDFLGRRLGGSQEHIAILHRQELNGLAREMRAL
jgi:dTDP-4-dehydrorhamnose reductase